MAKYLADEDGLDGSPWWVRAFVRVGMPTAFSAILLWYLMTNVTGSLTALQIAQTELSKTQAVVIQNQARIIELLMENAGAQRENALVLAALCYNSAKTADERARCQAR